MQDQDGIAELERRISVAIGRIGSGVERLSARAEALLAARSPGTDAPVVGHAVDQGGGEVPAAALADRSPAHTSTVGPAVATAPPPPAPIARAETAEIARLERLIREKDAEILRLRDALAAEKAGASDMAAKLRLARDRESSSAPGALEARVEKMTRQLDVQGLELQRMRKTVIQLREHLRVLHEAAAEGLAEPHLVNKAMLAELEALRAARHVDLAEVDEILAELEPLIEEARAHG